MQELYSNQNQYPLRFIPFGDKDDPHEVNNKLQFLKQQPKVANENC
jgi:hypothetical protein